MSDQAGELSINECHAEVVPDLPLNPDPPPDSIAGNQKVKLGRGRKCRIQSQSGTASGNVPYHTIHDRAERRNQNLAALQHPLADLTSTI